MSFPPLQPIRDLGSFVSGDVMIDPSVAIAPGVLLQADSDSRITIAAGACIGMGSILHAHQGHIEIATGATIGSGVLIVGTCKVGANACVGSVTTILNQDVESGQVIPAGSILGDQSRPTPLIEENPPNASESWTQEATEAAISRNGIANSPVIQEIQAVEASLEAVPESEFWNGSGEAYTPATQSSIHAAVVRNTIANNPISPVPPTLSPVAETEPAPEPPEPQAESPSEPVARSSSKVYGQEHLKRLMGTLFPYNQP